ncbi:hypothetical protein [Pseudomonas sp. RT6P73]
MTSAMLVKTTIAKVTGAKGDIPNGGTTDDTEVSVSGSAMPGQVVELLKNDFSQGSVVANKSGNWAITLTHLAVGRQTIFAKANGETSQHWIFNVIV